MLSSRGIIWFSFGVLVRGRYTTALNAIAGGVQYIKYRAAAVRISDEPRR